jgi:cytochrome oxidase Cu insertion factor (SCO1/SenC/PrrC family)
MAISSAINLLRTAGNKVQPIFITVDPERDTVKQLSGCPIDSSHGCVQM